MVSHIKIAIVNQDPTNSYNSGTSQSYTTDGMTNPDKKNKTNGPTEASEGTNGMKSYKLAPTELVQRPSRRTERGQTTACPTVSK